MYVSREFFALHKMRVSAFALNWIVVGFLFKFAPQWMLFIGLAQPPATSPHHQQQQHQQQIMLYNYDFIIVLLLIIILLFLGGSNLFISTKYMYAYALRCIHGMVRFIHTLMFCVYVKGVNVNDAVCSGREHHINLVKWILFLPKTWHRQLMLHRIQPKLGFYYVTTKEIIQI